MSQPGATNKYDTVELVIMRALSELPRRLVPGDGDSMWTRKLAQELTEFGRSLGFRSRCTGNGLPDSEWLWDFVWSREEVSSQAPPRLTDLVLVGECEWSHTFYDRWEDFHKLMVAKAEHRLMIVQVSNFSKFVQEAIARVAKFAGTSPGDRYLIANLAGSGASLAFEYHLHVSGVQ